MEASIWQLLGLGIGQGRVITSRLDAVDKIRMIRALGESALTEPQWHSLSETMARIDMLFCALDRRAADVVPPRRRLRPALDEAVCLPVIQFADACHHACLHRCHRAHTRTWHGTALCSNMIGTLPREPMAASGQVYPKLQRNLLDEGTSMRSQLAAMFLVFSL